MNVSRNSRVLFVGTREKDTPIAAVAEENPVFVALTNALVYA